MEKINKVMEEKSFMLLLAYLKKTQLVWSHLQNYCQYWFYKDLFLDAI